MNKCVKCVAERTDVALTATFSRESASYGGGPDSVSEHRSAPWSGQAVSEITVPITSDRDIFAARQKGRALATELGFSSVEGTLVATTISEVARDVLLCPKGGKSSSNRSNRKSGREL